MKQFLMKYRNVIACSCGRFIFKVYKTYDDVRELFARKVKLLKRKRYSLNKPKKKKEYTTELEIPSLQTSCIQTECSN